MTRLRTDFVMMEVVAGEQADLGDVLGVVGRTTEAQPSYGRALAILEELVKANPTVTANQMRLVEGPPWGSRRVMGLSCWSRSTDTK